MTELADLFRPGAGRGLDFVILDDLRKRLVEYARCYMILWGMEDTKETI